MENIRQTHRRLYNDNQLEQLCLLVSVLHDQPFFICDVDPEIDIVSPYFKAEDYPTWSGGKDNFSVGTDKVKRLWLLPFWKYTSTCLIGELKWEFNVDTFKSIDLVIYKPIMTFDEKQKSDQMVDLLQQTFKCKVNCYNKQFAENVAEIKSAQTAGT